MSQQRMNSKVRALLVSSALIALTLSVPTSAHAEDKAGSIQEVPQDAAWAQKNAAKTAPQTNVAPKAQGKAKRQWTHTVQAKCTRGGVTLNLTEGATCPSGFKKK